MGDTTNDPWAQAAGGSNGESQVIPEPAEDQESSQLFGGGSVAPSLFNKTHLLGTERTGIITNMFDRQKVDYNSKQPLFWPKADSAAAAKRKPVSIADGGDPKQRVMDTFFELSTDYAMSPSEAAATGRETPYEGGERVFVAGGFDLKATRKGIEAAQKSGILPTVLTKAAFVGKRMTVKRTGQKPNPGGNPSWVIEVTFSNA